MTTDKTASEFATVISCNLCTVITDRTILRDQDFNLPQPGYVGRNYFKTRVLLVGQNPGGSPERFTEQDILYARALAAVAASPSPNTMGRLQDILDIIIPTWPVAGNYFPLSDCGLALQDIAYLNLVRCRTNMNAAPSDKMVSNCLANHFLCWLDWLGPRVVICIGKWAYDRTASILINKGLPHSFVNRMRSLSSAERQANRQTVVQLVQSILERPAAAPSKEEEARKPFLGYSPVNEVPVARITSPLPDKENKQGFNSEAYFILFQKLGFHEIDLRKKLKHPRFRPTVYFNRSRDELVYFTIYTKDAGCFNTNLWDFIVPQQKKDDSPELKTVTPKQGMEEQAFRDILG